MSQSYLKMLFSRRKSLAEELAEVLDSVAELKKLGLNDEDPEDAYAHLRTVDICNAFRGELLQRGIMFIPKDVEQSIEYTDGGGEDCIVKTEFSLIRQDETLFLGAAYGHAKDRSDKALAIAQTAAFKAQLKRISMIYGAEDDPEKNRDTLTPKESVRIASYQRRAWEAGVRDSGLSHEKISSELSTLMGFPIDSEQIPDLPRSDFDTCMKWLLNHQDLAGQWAKAVAEAKAKKAQPVANILDRTPKDEPQYGD